MGYEIKLHIGNAAPAYNEPDADGGPSYDQQYGRSIMEIASFDLSGTGYSSRIYKLTTEAQNLQALTEAQDGGWGIHTGVVIDNNEQRIREDNYGKPVAAIPLEIVLEALKADFEDSKPEYAGHGYRRFEVAIALIEGIINRFPAHKDGSYPLVALTYGH